MSVDERRFDELIDKRGKVGLSDEEANELGRLFAEKEGKEYSNARSVKASAEEHAPADRAGEAEPERQPVQSDRLPAEDRTTPPRPRTAAPQPPAEPASPPAEEEAQVDPDQQGGPGSSSTDTTT